MAEIKTGIFTNKECECKCGNKHQLYGGKGYKSIFIDGYSNGKINGGMYHHIAECKVCGEQSEFKQWSE